MAFTSIEGAIDALQTAAGAVSGVMYKPDDPPEKMGDEPFLTTYPTAVEIVQGPANVLTYLWDITVELHANRKELPRDIPLIIGYAESIPNALFDCLNDNAAAQESATGSFGAMQWGEDDTIGWRWVLRKVKIQKVIT